MKSTLTPPARPRPKRGVLRCVVFHCPLDYPLIRFFTSFWWSCGRMSQASGRARRQARRTSVGRSETTNRRSRRCGTGLGRATRFRRVECPDRRGASNRAITEKDLAKAETLPADAMLCPSHLWAIWPSASCWPPCRRRFSATPSGAALRVAQTPRGGLRPQIMAVPFGSPVFCCYYRADLLEKLGRRPPKTWAEYQDLAKLLAEKGKEERGERRGKGKKK